MENTITASTKNYIRIKELHSSAPRFQKGSIFSKNDPKATDVVVKKGHQNRFFWLQIEP